MKKISKVTTVIMFFSCTLVMPLAYSAPQKESIVGKTDEELISMAEALYDSRETKLEKVSEESQSANLAETLEAVKTIESELLGRGTEILPAVEHVVWGSTNFEHYRARLVFGLKEIEGVETDQLLVRVSFADPHSVGAVQGRPDVIRAARDALIWRGKHGQGIGVSLSPEQLDALVVAVREENNLEAMNAAALLAVFTRNATDTRIKPVVERLVRVQENRSGSVTDLAEGVSYDRILGMHVGIFQSFGKAAQPYLREALIESEDVGETTKWLTLALGFAGDSSVSEDVRAIANNLSEAVEVRCIAIASYSAAAGMDAIPQLEEWKKDTTTVVSEMHSRETYPIALTANEKWLQLRKYGETR